MAVSKETSEERAGEGDAGRLPVPTILRTVKGRLRSTVYSSGEGGLVFFGSFIVLFNFHLTEEKILGSVQVTDGSHGSSMIV